MASGPGPWARVGSGRAVPSHRSSMSPRILAAVAACLLVGACAAPRDGGPEAGRVAVPAVGSEAQGSVRSFVQVVSDLEPVAEAECRRVDPNRNCDFRIVVDDRPGLPPNAYQTIDGSGRPLLAVTVGLFELVRNEDEMALILSHEAAHHIAGHLDRQARNAALGAQIFGEAAIRTAGATPEAIRIASEFGAALGARQFSKELELEADAVGARVALLAGYNPLRGAALLTRLPDPGNRFLGTHPSNAERIATVELAVAQARGGV
jgi:hypothetical protein